MIFNRQVTASGGAAPVLLWENTSQNRDYTSTQWITLGGDYDAYIVEAGHRSNAGGPFHDLTYNYIPADGSMIWIGAFHCELVSGEMWVRGNCRKILGVTRNSIRFGKGYTVSPSTEDQFAAVPYRVWGLKETI